MSLIGKIIFASSVVVGILSILLILFYQHKNALPNLIKPSEGYTFDYIVVGAGTAGSILATLLTKHSNYTVLLIEAGDRFGFVSNIPLLATFLQKSVNDWSFFSVKQKHSSKGLYDQRQAFPRGKGLGGSSQMNYMLYFYGYEKDFDRWAQMGLTQWSFKDLKPFLDAVKPKGDELLEIDQYYSKLAEAFDRAQADFEHKAWNFRKSQFTVKNGYRWGVFQKYLQTAFGRPNLKIITNAMVSRINIYKYTTKSVTINIKGENEVEETFDIHVRKEIILSSGAYQTPQILLASGIGPKKLLERLNITVQMNLPRVGQNLFDHMNLPLFVSIREPASINLNALLQFSEVFKYIATGKGHFGNFGVIGHIDDLDNNYGLMLFGVGAIDESALMTISNFKRDNFRALFPLYHNSTQEGFVLISTCFQPKARGYVSVRTRDVRKNPFINPNYLSEKEDVDCTIRAIRTGVKIVMSDAFHILKPTIHWPKIQQCTNFGPFARDFEWNQPSDKYLECILRHVGLGSHHPAGSCSMGLTPADSVVDQEMRVHGIKGLRIVDASIIPAPLSGNPNSVVMAMALRGTFFILRVKDN